MVEQGPRRCTPCEEVRRTSQSVFDAQSSVIVDDSKIGVFVEQLEERVKTLPENKFVFDKWADWHLKQIGKYTLEQISAYCFVVDAMNFCFWPDNPSGEFEYENITRNLEKILDADPSFFTPARLSQVTEEYLREHVFDGNLKFCLVDERARLVRQLGSRLIETGHEGFLAFIKSASKEEFSCPVLVKAFVDTFEGFRDQAIYKGYQVFFYKRAQILIGDLIGAFDDFREATGEQVPQFSCKEELTMFADYRVPQILRHVGIFRYSDELATLIDSEQEMSYSSTFEVELRAATVVTVEKILHLIRNKGSQVLKSQIKYAFQVDWLLWQYGENALQAMKPHHRVLSIFY